MQRRIITLTVVGIFILAVLGGLYLFINPLGPTLSHTIIETGDRQHKESGDYYTIQINYPDKTPLATRGSWGAEGRAQSDIASALVALIDQFKQAGDVDNMSQAEKDRLKQAGLTYSLNVGYLRTLQVRLCHTSLTYIWTLAARTQITFTKHLYLI